MKKLLFLGGLLSLQVNSFAITRYVKSGGAGSQTGASWVDASGDLQFIINQSSSAVVDTICVAAGTYLPNRPADNLNIIDATNRNNAFTFTKNVRVYGGFPVTGNPQWANRNWKLNITVLSGDIGIAGNNADNTYRVVLTTGSAIDNTFMMDGFTISDALADIAPSVTVAGTVIANRFGVGWSNYGGSPKMRNLIITNNKVNGGTAYGLGFANLNGSPELSNAIISNNTGSLSYGGAWHNSGGRPVLNNVVMQGNMTDVGGAWSNFSGIATLNNVTIAGNFASNNAGACFVQRDTVNFNNAIIFNNASPGTPGVHVLPPSPITPSFASYRYSLVQQQAGGSNGNLNGIALDPLFTAPLPPTFAPTAGGDYHIMSGSPCINVGNNALVPAGSTDLDGQARVLGTAVDMGAYEFMDVPLSINTKEFSASASQCDVILSWKGENESGMSHYEIETAEYGKDFRLSGHVDARNTPSATYQFKVGQQVPTAYYRIRSIDVDGSFNLSEIIPVTVNCPGSAIIIFPNPASDEIQISGITAGQYVTIIDVHGKTVFSKQASGSRITIPVKEYISGLYYMRVLSQQGIAIHVEQIIVK